MNDGSVEQIGTQPELYDRPANLFVATFTGSPAMNILPGRVTDGGIFVAGVANVAIKANISAGTEISYGLPPDDVVIGGEGNLPAEVVVVEPTGAETHIIARLGGHEITVVSKSRLDAKPGDVLPVSLTSERSHLFEASTGRRM